MKKTAKTARATRLVWSLALGLGLAIGLLVVLATGQQAQAQGGEPDVGVWKWNTGGHARPGGVYVYGIYYQNYWDAPATATDTIIVDTLPMSTTYADDTSGITPDIDPSGRVITWHLGDLAPGDDGGFMVTLDVSSTVPTGGEVITGNCVFITSTVAGDSDLSDNNACAGRVDVWEDEVEIGVDKWPQFDDPTPGQRFFYSIEWCNHRGAAAGPVWLTDTLPLSTTLLEWGWYGSHWEVYWTEVTTTGGQVVLYAPGLPGDWCQELWFRLLLDRDAPLSTTLENDVVIDIADDVDPGNNYRTNKDAHVSGPRYDMGVDKWVNIGVFAPGGWVDYRIDYRNQGNSAVHAWVTDTLPEGAYYVPGSAWRYGELFTPTITTTEYVVWDLGVIGVGEGDSFDVWLAITDTLSAPTDVVNCATVGITRTEDTPLDNTNCITVTIYDHGPNLWVRKDSWWNRDSQLGYQIYFANIGDDTVYNGVLTDTYPPSTTVDWGSLGWDYDRNITVTDNYTDNQVIFVIEELQPAQEWNIWFNANLTPTLAGQPLQWFTNTVEIEERADEANPDDNSDQRVDFSGGEVRRAEIWMNPGGNSNMWGEAQADTTVTVTTPYTQVTAWADSGCGGCWNIDDAGTINPGDTITVEAGSGLQPVVIPVPDPFTAEADPAADIVFGQIGGWTDEKVETHGDWPGGYQEVPTDASGHYTATYGDVPRGAQGYVRYVTEIDYAEVIFHRPFWAPDLVLRVNYGHDWVEGHYEPGHTVWITVTESDGLTVKGTAELHTGPIPDWDGESGFSTSWEGWSGDGPDIEPGDWVSGAVDNGYTAAVRVGTISDDLDVVNDTISGTIHANWFTQPLNARCEVWEPGGPGGDFTVDPNGGSYYCDFGAMGWDLLPSHDVGVRYEEPDNDWVINVFEEPVPRIRVDKQADGNPAEGGNFTFRVGYRNEGRADAEDVVITDTMWGVTYLTDTSPFTHTGSSGAAGDPIVWYLGIVSPTDDWTWFDVFVAITGVESDTISNTVQIATSNPYDEGPPEDRERMWEGHVEGNDTHLNVGKGAWTGDPAAGTEFVYSVNVCNNGGTNSSQVTITDTLHPSMTLRHWWGQHPGWTEVVSSSHKLVVSRPSLPPWGWCSEVYLVVYLDAAAWEGMEITNTAVISASNDMEDDDNTAPWGGNVGSPRFNLRIEKHWNWGRLVPDGELRYNINYNNEGNIPLTSTIRITDTLPVSTTFSSAWRYDEYGTHLVTPVSVTADYVVWEISGVLYGGEGRGFEVILDVDRDAIPGTELVNTVEISPLPGEWDYDDNVAKWVETLYDHGPNLRVRKEGWWEDWDWNTRVAWFNINIQNVGDERVESVTVTDTYPISMQLSWGVGVDWGGWWDWRDDPANHVFTVTFDEINPGDSTWINFEAFVTETIVPFDEPLPFGWILTNTVEVTLDPDDTDPDDNVDEVILTTGPDLFVEKTLVAGAPLPGEVITLSLRFGNAQERVGYWHMQGDLRLVDILPDGLEYVAAKQRWCGWTQWCDRPPDFKSGSLLLWQFGPMGVDNWDEIHLAVRIADTAEGDDVFTNLAQVSSSDPGNDIEPYYDNNEDSYDVVIALPKLEVDKVYEGNEVAGTVVTYTLTVSNTGSQPGSDVVLSDTVPALLSNAGGDGTKVGGDITWSFISDIAPYTGTANGWFSATLPCTVDLAIVNDTYLVVTSTEGVASLLGAPVSFDTLSPDINVELTRTPGTILAGDTVYFTATASTNGTPLSYEWDFGDGPTSGGLTASHLYAQGGSYRAVFTATDTCGHSEAATVLFTVQQAGLTLSPDRTTSAPPGSAVVFTHTLTNTGNSADIFDLSVSPAPAGWIADVYPGSVSLAAEANAQVQVVIVAATDATSGTVATVIITATSQQSGDTASVTDKVTVLTRPAAPDLTPTLQWQSRLPGATATFTHTLVNRSNASETFTNTATALLGGWSATVAPGTLSLLPYGQGVITVTVTVPGRVLSDTVGAVVVHSEAIADSTRYDESADLVRVQQVVGIALASDESGEAEPGQVKTYVHTLTNDGNAEDTFALAVTPVWNATVEPALLTWPAYTPGGLVTVTVQVPSGVPSGTVQTVVVTATSQTDSTVFATVTDTTTVKEGVHTVYLPLVLRNY